MARKTAGLMVALALSFSWAAPVLARPEATSHACCMGGAEPKEPSHGVPACCRPSEGLPPVAAAAMTAPTPALLTSVVISAEPKIASWRAPARSVAASPLAPPGTHSGLSPPSFGR